MSGALSAEDSALVRAGFLFAGCALSLVAGGWNLAGHLVDRLRRR